MAIAFGAAGAWATGTTSLTVPYPSGITAGQLLVLYITGRYSIATTPTPTGFTLQTNASAVASGGAGTNALNTGTSKVWIYTRIADGSETGSLVVAVSGNNFQAIIERYTKAAVESWDIAASVGGDVTVDTAYSVTGTAIVSFMPADLLLSATVTAADTPTYSAQAFTATGATFGTATSSSSASTTANHQRAGLHRRAVTAGGGTVAPVFTQTLSSADAGSTGFLRLREVGATTTWSLRNNVWTRRGYVATPPPSSVMFGFNNGLPWSAPVGTDTSASWKTVNATMGGEWRRSFSGGLPTWAGHTASGDAAQGIKSFWSVKPPNNDRAGFIAGNYDAQLAAFAAAATDGSYGTMYHEPENDMQGAEFINVFRKFYTVCKTANPTLQLGYAAMEYQWDLGLVPTANKTTNPDAWWMGADYCDWLGTDVYGEDWHVGNPPRALKDMGGFKRWYNWASTKAKPLVIAEISIVLTRRQGGGGNPYTGTLLGSFTDAQRANWITEAMTWMQSTGQFTLIMWWHNDFYAPTTGDGSYVNALTGAPAGNQSPLALQAWNNFARPGG
jgi:hypothetical protein